MDIMPKFESSETIKVISVKLASGKTLQVELKEPVKLSADELNALEASEAQQLQLFVLYKALGLKTSIED